MTPAPVRRHVFVSGQVQGVAFRYATRAEARRVGVAGWTRNLSDGRVEAVFEGHPEAVEAMLAFCRVGPDLADVSGVEERAEAPCGEQGFEIRHD